MVALAGLLLACAPAGAAAEGTATPAGVKLVPGYQSLAGPAFAGPDRLAWAGPSQRHGFEVRVREPDGSVGRQHVDAQGGGPVQYGVKTVLAASAERVALAVNVQRCTSESECKYMMFHVVQSEVFAAPLGGPVAFRGCGAGLAEDSLDLEGTVIAYRDSCARGIVVRDLSAPGGTPWRTFPGLGQVRIAGAYVAFNELRPEREPGDFRTQVAVYEWRSGERVYEVDGVNAFDLQDDGTLALRLADGGDGYSGRLAVASPADPVPRSIAQLDGVAALRIARSRIALLHNGVFRVLDLEGNELIAGQAADLRQGFDFDGERVAYQAQPCQSSWAVTWDLQGAPPALPAGRCPHARLASRGARADLRRRRLAVDVRCPAEPALGCAGIWGFWLDRLSPRFGYSRTAALEPGERRTLRFSMPAGQACAVARRRPRRLLARMEPYAPLRAAEARGRQAVRVRSVGKPRGCGR